MHCSWGLVKPQDTGAGSCLAGGSWDFRRGPRYGGRRGEEEEDQEEEGPGRPQEGSDRVPGVHQQQEGADHPGES